MKKSKTSDAEAQSGQPSEIDSRMYVILLLVLFMLLLAAIAALG